MVAMGASAEGLLQVLTRLRDEELADVTADQVADDVVELRKIVDWLEVEWIRRVAALAEKDGLAVGSHSSMTAFLKHRCHMSGARAQRAVALANELPKLPFVSKALETDDLSFDQALVFTQVPDHLSDDVARDEVTLVSAVSPLSVADTRRVIEYWKAAVDGPGCEANAEELADRRYLFGSRTMDGMVKLDGLLDPVAGELVLTALDVATPPPAEDDDRSPRQRRADALADVARSFLDSGEAAGSEKPHVLILTDLDALQGQGGGLHETAGGMVLTAQQVREYACDCTVSRVVFGSGSEPIDIGRATRVVPSAMRRALIARDRHCQHPGCDRSHRWCDAHHIQHWADHGPTALWNLKLLCRFHHTLVHRQSQLPPTKPP